ncbi:MAG: PhoH family protein, partial [Bacteroidetes bacterium]|nr:PhoH family protein [Bacteroidota bacterium]
MVSEEMIHIKNLISDNRIDKGLRKLKKSLSNTRLEHQLVIITSDFNNLKEKIQAGVLNHENETIERNRIIFSLLKLLKEIEDSKVSNDSPDPNFSDSIREKMTELDKKVEKLTNEQYRALRLLRNLKKVRISGCAGSGKTLVAAEKAIRLSKAGLNTLFLCHNPYLAKHIQGLVKGTPVNVSSFGNWVRKLNQEDVVLTNHWSNVYEPTTAELNRAFDKIERFAITFDAIIVDEGQDFRQDWWTLLELSLRDTGNGIFYIFHDDNQALLPFRSVYPIQEPVIDLSRNCRNGGKIYQLMKNLFHHQA